MTVFTEEFTNSAAFNESLCFGKAWPLPRLTPSGRNGAKDTASKSDNNNNYEVIVVGAGPAGLFLTLQLARLGLPDTSLLCVEAKASATQSGHADGVNARTQEILRTFGLESEILREGRDFSEQAVWGHAKGDASKLERRMMTELQGDSVRFTNIKTIHQGRMERILTEDLRRYSGRGVEYSTRLVNVCLDLAGDEEYPVLATVEQDGQLRSLRAKYLVGADGAHSAVRKSIAVDMEGDMTDRIWGVVDFVADTDFPDVRRPSVFEGDIGAGRGDALLVPRERLSNGEYLTRFYVDMTDYGDVNGHQPPGEEEASLEEKLRLAKMTRLRRAEITQEDVLNKAATMMCQYRFKVKKETRPFWWAAYSVGQRLATKFIVEDSKMEPRIFLIGDACHTHSPRQGQGMNISMADSYNLAWKLAYSLYGLTPNSRELLRTYGTERRPAASKVVFFDKRWNQSRMTQEEKMAEMVGQILGCGVEYDPSIIVNESKEAEGPTHPLINTKKDYLRGTLCKGRRLANLTLKRFADSTPWDIQDDLLSNGRYRIMVICSGDFPDVEGRSLRAVTETCEMTLSRFAHGMVEAIIVQPDMEPTWHFKDLPVCVKDAAEMRLYCGSQEAYDIYGVDVSQGAMILVRPDGMVGMISKLEDVGLVDQFLQQVLVAI